MPTSTLTRRAALVGLSAAAVAPRAAMAQGPVRFRRIEVDVGPLRAAQGDPTAAWVEEALPGALARVLGPYLAPGDRNGATLIARIDFLYLGPSSGGAGVWGASQDTISGALIVQGPRGGLAGETPLRAITSYHPTPVDQPLWVQSNHDRIVTLARAFAGWAPRELGL